jgi:hypothetical protein
MDAESEDEAWWARVRELIGLVGRALPKLQCVRCASEDHYVRVYRNPLLKPAFATDEAIDLVCKRCGLLETHVADCLIDAVKSGALPRDELGSGHG